MWGVRMSYDLYPRLLWKKRTFSLSSLGLKMLFQFYSVNL